MPAYSHSTVIFFMDLALDNARVRHRHGLTPTLDGFPFFSVEVQEVHHHKIGEGRGLWFRLRDGRVFNDRGRITDSDPLLYDRRSLPH